MHPTPSNLNPIHWTIKKIYAPIGPMYLSEHFMTILRSNHLHPKIHSLILPPKTLILTKYVSLKLKRYLVKYYF